MTGSAKINGVAAMITLECPWCAAPAAIIDQSGVEMFVCSECAVSAPIAPERARELAAA